jgi:hypothetical protein
LTTLKLKYLIHNSGGRVAYSDTDSLVCNMELPSEYVSGSNLGLMKLEHKIEEGYFLA